MSATERQPEHICDDGCGRVDVRGAIEGPWALCMNCGARTTEYVPASQLQEAAKRADDWREAVENILSADFHYPEEYRQALQEALDAMASPGQEPRSDA